ncbi:MAG: DUF6036 family nucleotidyltransferase [Gammaproteobacteria bacterium]|nr:DUF6036 family nucleotidyltransferase [Gammaproteobacteria bacterium]
MPIKHYHASPLILSKMHIENALKRLGDLLQEQNEHVELITAGGVVSVLLIGNRNMTRDIDAIFPDKQHDLLVTLIDQVSQEQNLPSGKHAWLNDGVSFFGLETKSNNVVFKHSNLTLYSASWYELLGMKLSGAWRRDSDFDDAIEILKRIGSDNKLDILKKSIKHKNFSPYTDDETYTKRFNRTWNNAYGDAIDKAT